MTAEQTIPKRNWQFDFLKGVSCIFVIFLHCPFPGTFGDLIIYACRFPVPIFFMITGYYCYHKDKSWIKKKSIGILKMLVLTELFYGIWNCLRSFLSDSSSVNEYLKSLDVVAHPLRILLFGSVFNGTLWYLYAAFWTYCVLYILLHKDKINASWYFLIPVLLCLQIFGRFYWQNHYDIEAGVWLFRSALLFGVPLTLLGHLFAHWSEQIQSRMNWLKSISVIILGGLLIVAEYLIAGQYMDFHLSTVFVSAGLFLLAMTYPYKETKLLRLISFIGRKLSMWIYLSHIFFSNVLSLLTEKYSVISGPLFTWTRPILVCLCSALFAYLASLLQTKKKI